MGSFNQAIIWGNLGKDPDGVPGKYCNFSVATNERKKSDGGEYVDAVEWHNVTVIGKASEHCMKYLTKGSNVHVVGRLETTKYEDKQGVTKYSTKIVTFNVQFGSKAEPQQSADAIIDNPALDEIPF